MNKDDVKNEIMSTCKELLFENVDNISDFFDPFIEDGKIEKYDWEFNENDHSVMIQFFFNEEDSFTVTIGAKK